MTISAKLQAMHEFQRITVRPLSGALGAEVSGVDLSKPVSGEIFAEILSAFHAHLVLFFRAQTLTREHLEGLYGPLWPVIPAAKYRSDGR